MRFTVGAAWIALLAFVPIACVQAAVAQELTGGGGSSLEQLIAQGLAVVLTSAGAPAAVVTGVATVVAVACRYTHRAWTALAVADPMDLRFRIGGRTFTFSVEVEVPVPAPATRERVTDPTDAPHRDAA